MTDDYEVLIIDDGSPDRSGELADQLAAEHEHVRAIHHETNLGYGAAIRTGLAASNGDLPDEQRMWFRIGVNLGDVASDGDNLMGNGINIAARLEQIAEPGGICLSGTVQDHLAGNLDLALEDAG